MFWKRKPSSPAPSSPSEKELISLAREGNELSRQGNRLAEQSNAVANSNRTLTVVSLVVAVLTLAAAIIIAVRTWQLSLVLQRPVLFAEADPPIKPMKEGQLMVESRLCNVGILPALKVAAYATVAVEGQNKDPEDMFAPQFRSLAPGGCMPVKVTQFYRLNEVEAEHIPNGSGGELKISVHLKYRTLEDPNFHCQVQALRYEYSSNEWINMSDLTEVSCKW